MEEEEEDSCNRQALAVALQSWVVSFQGREFDDRLEA